MEDINEIRTDALENVAIKTFQINILSPYLSTMLQEATTKPRSRAGYSLHVFVHVLTRRILMESQLGGIYVQWHVQHTYILL